jgi:hypothetical protein
VVEAVEVLAALMSVAVAVALAALSINRQFQ